MSSGTGEGGKALPGTGDQPLVELYVKRDGPPCAKCHAAEEKLHRLGVPYVRYFIEERLLDAYPGWRNGGVERATAWDVAERPIPFFYFPTDGIGCDYPAAMKTLKQILRSSGE